MPIRWPIMLRRTHEAELSERLRWHHTNTGDLHDKLNRAERERRELEAEIGRLKEEIDRLKAKHDALSNRVWDAISVLKHGKTA